MIRNRSGPSAIPETAVSDRSPRAGGNAVVEFILGIIVLILDIWALVSIIGSAATTGSKVLWILLILILPVVGFIIWYFAGPRGRAATA